MLRCLDVVGVVCARLDTVQQLAMLCRTNKFLRDYLYSGAGGKHWTDIARRICGEDHWPPVRADQPGAGDGRYVAMLRLCPWVAVPQEIQIRVRDDVENMGCYGDISGMLVEHDKLHVRLNVSPRDNTNPLFPHDRKVAVTVSARPWVQHMQVIQDQSKVAFVEEDEEAMSSAESDLFVRAKASLTSPYFVDAEMMSLFVVHDAVCAISFSGCVHENGESVLFFTTNGFRFLGRLPLAKDDCKSCLVFAAGEIWVVTEGCDKIYYFGASQGDTRWLPSERYDVAFSALCDGRFREADRMLRQDLGCDLKILCGMGGLSCLHYAVKMNNAEAVKYFIQAGVSVDLRSVRGSTPAYMAACAGNCDMLALLIELGADVNAGVNGSSYLVQCILHFPNVPVISLLVSNRADVNGAGASGFTPLVAAGVAFDKKQEVVRILCMAGADVNARDSSGATAIYKWMGYTIHDGVGALIPVMREFGCDFNTLVGPEQISPLMRGVAEFNFEKISCLVQMGADIAIKNAHGKTAGDILQEAIISINGGTARVWYQYPNGKHPITVETVELEKARVMLGCA